MKLSKKKLVGHSQPLGLKMTPPPLLYKYEALTTQSLLNLKRQIIHFGSPLNFNDPYDCALTPNIEIPSDADIETIRKNYLRGGNLPEQARIEFETFSTIKLRDIFYHKAQEGLETVIQDFLRTKGVACFSESNDDLLMWSHYGGHYKGFCLEFATSSEPFKKINKIHYTPTLPRLNIASILLDKDFHIVQELFCTKSKAWSYEKEWRAIHNIAGTQFGYMPEALTGIYFGPDIDRQSLEIVCLILAGQNANVRLRCGSRSTTEFRVLFEEFSYTSYLEAKQKGLRE